MSPEDKDPAKTLDEFLDEKHEAIFAENQSIARSNRTLRSQLKEKQDELTSAKKRLEIYEALDEVSLEPPEWLVPKERKGVHHRAIPSMLLTDIHWGEKVNPEEVDGVNAYDRAIAEQRIQRAAEGAIKLCRDYLAGVEYEGFNLMLGGDLLSGTIHDELRETNVESVMDSVVGVLDSLVAAIRLLKSHFGKVDIAAVVGNHPRNTKKPRAKGRSADNFDHLIYNLVARDFRGDKNVNFRVAVAADLHFPVYNTHYCLTHGDQFRGGSGISGALAPLLLGVHRKGRRDAAAGNPWNILVMGHWHSSYFLKDLIVGGSVVGYDEYAYVNNLPFEPPQASLWLNSAERGVTAYMPVHLLDRKAEGW